MNEGNYRDEFLTFILLIAGVIGAIVAAIYFLALALPYLVFYVLPFLAASVLAGFTLRFFTFKDQTKDKEFARKHDQRQLALGYPFLIFLTLVIFHANDLSKVQVDKNGKENGQYLEWPTVHHKFNEWRRSAYANSSFESLRKEALVEVIYDRRQIGWIMWFALFLGGPIFYFWLSREDDHEDAATLRNNVSAQVKWREDRANEKQANVENEIRNATKVYIDQLEKIKAAHANVLAENQRLKATVEFSSEVPKPLTDLKKKGLLDDDLF